MRGLNNTFRVFIQSSLFTVAQKSQIDKWIERDGANDGKGETTDCVVSQRERGRERNASSLIKFAKALWGKRALRNIDKHPFLSCV